jgi:hypothetical protein
MTFLEPAQVVIWSVFEWRFSLGIRPKSRKCQFVHFCPFLQIYEWVFSLVFGSCCQFWGRVQKPAKTKKGVDSEWDISLEKGPKSRF